MKPGSFQKQKHIRTPEPAHKTPRAANADILELSASKVTSRWVHHAFQPLLLCLWGDWRPLMGEEPSQQALSPDHSARAWLFPGPEPAQDGSTATPPAAHG